MKRRLITLLLCAIATLSSACNTIQGIGKDVERGGEKVQETAKDVQRKL